MPYSKKNVLSRTEQKPSTAIGEDTTVAKKGVLRQLVDVINRQHGADTIQLMSDKPPTDVACVPTGIVPLDYAMYGFAQGGIPEGRIIELYGPESAGKTTLALSIVAAFQQHGKSVAYIDTEQTLDGRQAAALGVDFSSMLFMQINELETVFEVLIQILASNAVGLVVVDTLASCVTRSELNGDMGDSHVALSARIISQGLRKMSGLMSKSGTTVLVINQLRQLIGTAPGAPTETTPGGRAMKFYATLRLDIRRVQTLKDKNGDPCGIRSKVKVAKNKISPPLQEAEFEIMFGNPIFGINKLSALIEYAAEVGVVEKRGAFYRYGDVTLGQGLAAVANMLFSDKTLADAIYADVVKRKSTADISLSKNTDNFTRDDEDNYDVEAN
jgi:recombination protein RecA